MSTIGDRLRKARKAKGLSQYELAYRLGLPRAQIAQIELGRSQMPREIKKIARELGVSPAWLLFGDEKYDRVTKEGMDLALAWEELDDQMKEAIRLMIDKAGK